MEKEKIMESNEENINTAFSQMESEGWKTQEPLTWGFFFYSNEEENLKSVFSELSDHDYNIESLQQNEDNKWVMQVSKTEVLAPDKLHRRNMAFNELAEAYGSFYDGWDVGKST